MNINKHNEQVRIYGSGGHSQVIRELLEQCNVKVAETFDDKPAGVHRTSQAVTQGARQNVADFEHSGPPVIIAVGNNAERAELANLLNCRFARAIHQCTTIAPSAKIGEGTVVFAGAIIQPNTTIGKHVIINTAASIDHDNFIDDFAHISPKAALCGHVEVGQGSHVGVGAVVIPKVKIGRWCTIGAGAVILKDVPDYSVVVGNPGRIIKTKAPLNIPEMEESDLTFVGSGISTSFTILSFLDSIGEKKLKKRLVVNIIDQHSEFNTGVPYGSRSGKSALLINQLKNFLPEKERKAFITWMNSNLARLLKEFKEEGGVLAKAWISDCENQIKRNQWDDLCVPRRFFGCYINELVERKLEEFRIRGLIKVNFISSKVIDIEKQEGVFKISMQPRRTIISDKIVVAIGSLPTRPPWHHGDPLNDEKILFIDDPYSPGLDATLETIRRFLENQSDSVCNVAIVGANASALEMLYMLHEDAHAKSRIGKFVLLSTLGLAPDAVVDLTKQKEFLPVNLNGLESRDTVTAKELADAALLDIAIAEDIPLGAASSVPIISAALGSLLSKLNHKELRRFACLHGNEIGRRQRLATIQYAKTLEKLKALGRFEHLKARYSRVLKRQDGQFELEYLDTDSGENRTFPEPFSVIVNCSGGSSLDDEKIPELLANLIRRGYCKPNHSKIGFDVNQNLETVENLHVVGPLLAGNVVGGRAVWHVEHCGRIIWLAQILGNRLREYFCVSN